MIWAVNTGAKPPPEGLGIRRCWVTGRPWGREQGVETWGLPGLGPWREDRREGSIQDDGAPLTACDPGWKVPWAGPRVRA